MNRNLKAVCFVIFFLFLAASVIGQTERLSIVEPADKKLVEEELLPVVLKLEKGFEADKIILYRNKAQISTLTGVEGKEYVCSTITVRHGPNTIGVEALKAGKVLESRKISVFYRSDLSMRYNVRPPQFQVIAFHEGNKDDACKPCHRVEPNEKDRLPTKPQDSVCYSCHKQVAAYRYVHGPVSTWACLNCHDQESKPARYAVNKPDKDICFPCHVDMKKHIASHTYVHGPTATGNCTICHDPHASANPFWTRKPTGELCTSCHEKMVRHSFKVMALTPWHPVSGVRDPLRPGRELTCASCHNPHASNSRIFLAFDTNVIYDFCAKCHKYQ